MNGDDLRRLHEAQARAHDDMAALREKLAEAALHDAVLEARLAAVEQDIQIMASGAEARFVTLARFLPVERASYAILGLLGSLLLAWIIRTMGQ